LIFRFYLTDLNTDELKAKRANADRIKEFSKNLNSFNRVAIKEAAAESHEGGHHKAEKKSAREKMKDFSKHVPKPKARPSAVANHAPSGGRHEESSDGYGTAAQEYCISSEIDHDIYDYEGIEDNGGNSRLRELQEKHGENKKKADAIKKSLGLM
jgi:hypothetical protein